MDFRILGPLEIGDAGRIVDVGGPRHRTLLAALVLARNRVVSREQLVEVCWTGDPPPSAASLIHVRVSELRKALGLTAAGASPILTVSRGYRLDVAADDVDADRFEAGAGSGHRALLSSHHEAAVDLLRNALALWRGDPYVEIAEQPAAEAEIARLATIRLGAEDDLLQARLDLGEHAAVAAELESLVVQTPWAERRWALLMLAHYRSGRQAAALSAFSTARERLVDDLGIEPGVELRTLHEAVLNQDPDLRPPETGVTRRPEDPAVRASLPARLTSFVGRTSELAWMDRLLGDARLVTVAGPGGAGKTCLALEAAARAAVTQPGGVWLVELAPVTDRELVATTIASRLGISEQLGTGLVTQISEQLGAAPALLVLDNCEHLLDGVAGVVAQLLRETSSLTVLATSRERLGLTGEHVCQLAGLTLPVDGRDHLPDEVGRAEAAQLLVDRATAVRADFRLDRTTAQAVAKICRRLDGLPLAIELAAAATSALDVAQIAAMLDDRLELLEQGRPGRDLRHGSLESVVDWSYELLSAEERQFFAQVAVFQGTFSLASAEEVCRRDPGGPSVAALLWRLVDKSLLSSDSVGGGRRYRLLETLKEYALRRLAERGDLPQFRQRHAEHFLRLAETAGGALRGPHQRYRVAELEREHSNLRAAMEWFIENGQVESVTRLVGSIYAFWDLGGHYGEGRRWLTRALASPEGAAPGHRVRALMGSATLAVIQGDLRAADTFSAEVVELSRAHADHELLAHALQFRGLAAIFASDLATADELFAESLEAARLAGQPWLEAWAFEFQAAAELARGSYDAAVRLAGQSVALSRPGGDPECAAWALVTLATAQIEHGRVEAAIAPLQDSLAAFRQLGVSWGVSLAIFACAQLAGLRADHTAAASFLGASEQLRMSSRAGMLPGLQRSFDHWRGTCAAALGSDAFDAAWSAGAGEPVEQTLARAEQLLARSTPAAH